MEEAFSLEDDYGDMFITQSESVVNGKVVKNVDKVVGMGNPMDFQSPCASLLSSQNGAHYSDISYDNTFDIPCSQQSLTSSNDSRR